MSLRVSLLLSQSAIRESILLREQVRDRLVARDALPLNTHTPSPLAAGSGSGSGSPGPNSALGADQEVSGEIAIAKSNLAKVPSVAPPRGVLYHGCAVLCHGPAVCLILVVSYIYICKCSLLPPRHLS